MKAIIFGIGGQDGYYLSSLLREKGIEVIGITRDDSGPSSGIANYHWVSRLITNRQPDYIFHFAASSTTRHEALFHNFETISAGTLNILESVKNSSPHSKVFISGSGLQFRNEGRPIKESDEFEARDAYSMCRIQSVYSARYYRSIGVQAYVGYFFNHDSPRRATRHVSKMIAEAVKEIALGKDRQIEIGRLSVEKEWAFAGDIVEAVWTLVNQDNVHEAVLSCGEAHSIREYIEACFGEINKDWKQFVIEKEDFVPEYARLVGDPSLIKSLGWQPGTGFREMVKLMITQ